MPKEVLHRFTNYQTENDQLPSVEVQLKHGLMIDDKRVTTCRVRLSTAMDLKIARNHPGVRGDPDMMQATFLALVTTFEGVEDTEPKMILSLSTSDYKALMDASNEADDLPLSVA